MRRMIWTRLMMLCCPVFASIQPDEELVGFYLKRKIQQRSLPIELIKQVDIYKYDPWDLPKLASTGEKEWMPGQSVGYSRKPIPWRRELCLTLGYQHYQKIQHQDILNQGPHCTHFSPENVSCTTEIGSVIQLSGNTDLQQASSASFSAFDIPSYKPLNPSFYKPSLFPASSGDIPNHFMFSPPEISGPAKCTVDASSMLLNPALLSDVSKGSENIDFEGSQQQVKGFSISMPQEMQGSMIPGEDESGSRRNINGTQENSQWGSIRSIGFPFSLPSNLPEAWKPNLPWDSPPCPSEMSTTYSTNNCYT
ncbi:hypothetical protein Patl1_21918 [Pistacia atlantica]|uniref:Uncharacterized protein n=1 Tax=Pistacia atlantica TaxID=434234 RepID=A0ACC1BMJ6_9ROSI|nr:hypothetical protein Patl1_21918 [Pistacia atlantica]